MTVEQFTQLALSFPEVEQKGHFEKTSFRIRNKIFATLDQEQSQAVLKLNEIDQSVFCDSGPSVNPVPNKWGKQGWTIVAIQETHPDLVRDALTCAYKEVAPRKLGDLL